MKDQHPKSPDHTSHVHQKSEGSTLRLVAWETTRNCNLACIHCRASATTGPYSGELDTAEAFRLLDQIAEVAKPIIILTGGEPLLREGRLREGRGAQAGTRTGRGSRPDR